MEIICSVVQSSVDFFLFFCESLSHDANRMALTISNALI